MAKPETPTAAVPSLPLRTSLDDVLAICGYLFKRPTGAADKEIRAVLGPKQVEPRKLAGLKRWGLVDDAGERLRLLERGRRVIKDNGATRVPALQEIVRENEPYLATVERAAHKGELTATAMEVAGHWHDNFRGLVSSNEDSLNEQVLSFFQLAEGAGLGRTIVGRRGQPTRFEFDQSAVERFVDLAEGPRPGGDAGVSESGEPDAEEHPARDVMADVVNLRPAEPGVAAGGAAVSRVFITHGKNTKVLVT